MVFEERAEYLRKIIALRKEIQKDVVDKANEHHGLVNTVVEMEEIKKEAHKQMLCNPGQLQILSKKDEDRVIHFLDAYNWKPFEIDYNHSPTLSPTLIPIHHKVMDAPAISINGVVHIIGYDPNGTRKIANLSKYEISKRKEGFYIFTDELESLINGYGSDDVREINKYLQLLDDTKASKQAYYYLSLIHI